MQVKPRKMTASLIVPMLPVSDNVKLDKRDYSSRDHRRVWRHAVKMLAIAEKVPKDLSFVKARAIVRWNKPGKLPDRYNLCSSLFKPTWDGLQDAGVIADDDHHFAGCRGVKVYRSKKAETEIILEWESS